MKLLTDRIKKDGLVLPGDVLKVDSFLNHQIDVPFIDELAKEFYSLYKNETVDKILTIEASGIGIACLTAMYFKCPVIFAKKSKTVNMSGEFYTSEVASYTHKNTNTIIISKKYLNKNDNVLIIDDFLAVGNAMKGLIDIVKQSGANIVGLGSVIEKVYQNGGNQLRQSGYRVESLAKVSYMSDDGQIGFED